MAEESVTDRVEEFAEVLRQSRRFKAPREAVFRAFTDPAALAKWFGPEGVNVQNVQIDLRPGGTYSMEFVEKDGELIPLSGVYREIEPPRRLAFTLTWGSGGMAGLEALVTIELAEAGAETELTLIHEGLPSQEFHDLHSQGWASTFNCLDRLIDRGDLS